VRILLAVAALPATATAEDTPMRRAEVRLLSETTGVKPSGSIWVGLHVKLQPGWHTYWINPGDSGAPARVEWTLPAGVTAGEIAWPAPHRLSNPPFADYGYEGEVLLLVPIATPDAAPGSSVSLKADVRLLVCKDVCIPERTTVAVAVPVTGSPQSQTDLQAQFSAARRRVPGPPPSSWRLHAESRDRRVILAIETAEPPRAMEFFPLRPLEIRHAAPQPFRRRPAGATLTLEVDERLREPPARLTGVLVVDREQAVTVDVPVRSEVLR
jgi:thiol:disulfide interchange protein DsbD